MLIGELARQAGVSVQAVRLYERRGLLRKASRTPAGYRSYTEHDLEVLRAIKQCQRLGCSLAEVREIIAVFAPPDQPPRRGPHRAGDHSCLARVAALGEKKLAALERQIAQLSAVRAELREVLRNIRARLEPLPAKASPPRRRVASGRA